MAGKYADLNRTPRFRAVVGCGSYWLGFHARYQLGAAAPGRLCGGSLKLGLGPVPEVCHNALANRLGHAMTNTGTLTLRGRPAGSNNLFVAWETLAHGDNPA
jgi:hypothetical protein